MTGSRLDFGLARYNADGSLDQTFGTGGVTITPVGSYGAQVRAIGVQSDWKILVAGSYQASDVSNDLHVALVRYQPDGRLDPTFGAQGIATTTVGSEWDSVFALALRPNGGVLIGGGGIDVSGGSFGFAAGYQADGRLDPAFGTGGVVKLAHGALDEATGLAVQSNGKVLVGGFSIGTSEDFALARLNSDGTLDSSFGSGGVTQTPIGDQADARALALQPDGKIVLAGGSKSGSHWQMALARYNSDGSLDRGFGSGGTNTTRIGTGDASGTALRLQPDGKIVLGGWSSNIGGTHDARFALVRYLGTSPTTIAAAPEIVTFGSATTLSGTLTSPAAGSDVYLYAQTCGTSSETQAGSTRTGAGGAWTASLMPLAQTVYEADVADGSSSKVSVDVRPKVVLTKVGPHLFRARIQAAQSFADEIALVQLYLARTKRWVTIRKIVLRTIATRAGSVTSGTTFRSAVPRGRQVRLVFPQSQAGSCYLPGVSAPVGT
jgi:uncharacterized delta-60 repeat protein